MSKNSSVIRNSGLSSLFFFVLLVSALCLAGCRPPEPEATQVIAGETMGTYYRVTFGSLQEIDLQAIQRAIEAELALVNQSMSTYLPSSELSVFNHGDANQPISISSGFAAVVKQALEIAELTDGAFDITVGPLVRLWGFGPDGRIVQRPTARDIDSKLEAVSYKKLLLNKSLLSKTDVQTEIDLSAIAKGYAIDKVAQLLINAGFGDWLIDVGGELRASGRNGSRFWQVAIEKPMPNGGIQQLIPLLDQAIATSGDYRNYLVLDSKHYSHAIDPKTGYPVAHQLASASVLHSSAMQADALATALLVMGEKRAQIFAESQNLSVYLIVRNAKIGEYRVITTGEFTKLVH